MMRTLKKNFHYGINSNNLKQVNSAIKTAMMSLSAKLSIKIIKSRFRNCSSDLSFDVAKIN